MGPKRLIRVVLDTSVVVSALLFGGLPGSLIGMWKSGKILPLCSREIIDEYLKVLSYPKFQLSEEEVSYLLTQEILPWFEVVEVPRGKSYVKDDPEDDKFIWCAIVGKADFIVSGDKHLLELKSCPVRVIQVREFLKILDRLSSKK